MEKSILFLTILLLSGVAMSIDDQSFEMQVLEKEIEMKQLKKEIARFMHEILDERTEEIRNELREEITKEILVSCSDITPLVTFTADTPRETRIPSGHNIVFRHIAQNKGGGYDANTGFFTAPYDGLYQFTVHVCNVAGSHVVYSIVHNGAKVSATCQIAVVESCSSYTALVLMRKHDKVWVETTWATSLLLENIFRHNAFMGVLLNAHLH